MFKSQSTHLRFNLLSGTFFVLLLLLLLTAAAVAEAEKETTDTGKLSWSLYQQTQVGQRQRAAGEDVQTVSAMLTSQVEVTREHFDQLSEKGYTVVGSYGRWILVEAPADFYISEQRGLQRMDFVQNATLPPEPNLPAEKAESPMTSGTLSTGAPKIWNAGFHGKDVKIAVIDIGFDKENKKLQKLGPSYFLIKPSSSSPGAYVHSEGKVSEKPPDHGTACGIIAGDVAPQAELYLISYSKASSLIGWLGALDFAFSHLDSDVVSTSVVLTRPYSHADGKGLLNEEVSKIVSSSGSPLFIAAGNSASGSPTDSSFYDGTFSSSGDALHDFTDTEDTWDKNTLKLSGKKGDTFQLLLEWDSWEGDTIKQDLDLEVFTCDYRRKIGESSGTQYGTSDQLYPVEAGWLVLPYDGDYCIRVKSKSEEQYDISSTGLSFHLYMYSDEQILGLEHHSGCGSLFGASTNQNPLVVTVGALDGTSTDNQVRPYSSRGPTEGGKPGPDIYGPDGVYGTNYQRFYGTSAATPYMAGLYALLRSANPDLKPLELIDRLQKENPLTTDCCGNPVYPAKVKFKEVE